LKYSIDISLLETSVAFVVVALGIVGPLLNVKLIVVDISLTSVDLWDESGVELFDNVVEVGVAEKYIYIKLLFVIHTTENLLLETSAAVELKVDVEITVVDSSDDFMEVVSIVG
jgi:hypothetical protein